MNEISNLIPEVSALLAALSGGGIATGIAQFFIKRTITQLGSIPDKLHDITHELAVIKHRLDTLNEIRDDVKYHDRRIVALEVRHGNTDIESLPNGKRERRFGGLSAEIQPQ